jgi:hypothetical protein
MNDALREKAAAVENTAREMFPDLAKWLVGKPPSDQGAIIAALTARWLAGIVGATASETAAVRKQLLTVHVDWVRRLIPSYEEEMAARLRDRLEELEP